MVKKYGEDDFKSDLAELSKLVKAYNNNMKGGKKKKRKIKKKSKKRKTKKRKSKKKGGTKGGSPFGFQEPRTFKLLSVEGSSYSGKPIHGRINLKMKNGARRKKAQTPVLAAKKIFKSYCRSKGLHVKGKTCDFSFKIQEITKKKEQDKKKAYGPYVGLLRHLKPGEIKAIKIGKTMISHKREWIVEHESKTKKGGMKGKKKTKKTEASNYFYYS